MLIAMAACSKKQQEGSNKERTIGDWQPVAPLLTARYVHRSIVLNDSLVLVIGGDGEKDRLARCEIYDLKRNRWQEIDSLHTARRSFSLTRLNDGRLLVVGGDGPERAADLSGNFRSQNHDLAARRQPAFQTCLSYRHPAARWPRADRRRPW
ncbi:MAG: kelch repeat-containing protein [candidate division KSB1 bacterium]|nr:kelch repeat-containing protein [candidate division KSB1 bacterium]